MRTTQDSLPKIARDLGVSEPTLRAWMAATRPAAAAPLTTSERTELAQLRREVRQLREERDILKKATVNSGGRCNAMNDPRDHAARATIADERQRQGGDLEAMEARGVTQ
jgi:transposase